MREEMMEVIVLEVVKIGFVFSCLLTESCFC